jgi:anthranilate synthase component 2
MILLIDNYDSFSYNLYQLVGSLNPDIRVVRNDSLTPSDVKTMNPEAVILSPGPGRPADAGICEQVIRGLKGLVPIMGVCLGHQAIAEAYGASVTYAKELMHGKQSTVRPDRTSALFRNLPETIRVGRYHSLAVDESTLPETLRVTARSDDGEVMALEDTEHCVCGMQFHPESIMTPEGPAILKNFLEAAAAFHRNSSAQQSQMGGCSDD